MLAYFNRSVDETTLAGSPGSLYTGIGGNVEHDLTRDLLLILRSQYGNSDFKDIGRTDHDYESSLGLKYKLTPAVFMAGDLRNQNRHSTVSTASYSRNQIFFRLGWQY